MPTATARKLIRPAPEVGKYDRFTDPETGITYIWVRHAARWVNKRLAKIPRQRGKPVTISYTTMRGYCRDGGRGIAALGGQTFKIVPGWVRTTDGKLKKRRYVKLTDLRSFVAAVEQLYRDELVPLKDRPWLTIEEAETEFRRDREFIYKYSDVAHPRLGHKIGTDVQTRITVDGKIRDCPVYSRKDLYDLESNVPVPDGARITTVGAEKLTGIPRDSWHDWSHRNCAYRYPPAKLTSFKTGPYYAERRQRGASGEELAAVAAKRRRGNRHDHLELLLNEVKDAARFHQACQQIRAEKKQGLYVKDGKVYRSAYAAARDYPDAGFTSLSLHGVHKRGEIERLQPIIPNQGHAAPMLTYVYDDDGLQKLAGKPPRRGAVTSASDVPAWPPGPSTSSAGANAREAASATKSAPSAARRGRPPGTFNAKLRARYAAILDRYDRARETIDPDTGEPVGRKRFCRLNPDVQLTELKKAIVWRSAEKARRGA